VFASISFARKAIRHRRELSLADVIKHKNLNPPRTNLRAPRCCNTSKKPEILTTPTSPPAQRSHARPNDCIPPNSEPLPKANWRKSPKSGKWSDHPLLPGDQSTLAKEKRASMPSSDQTMNAEWFARLPNRCKVGDVFASRYCGRVHNGSLQALDGRKLGLVLLNEIFHITRLAFKKFNRQRDFLLPFSP